jgi:alpha-tubulin suppressor-like RCC1 family protein
MGNRGRLAVALALAFVALAGASPPAPADEGPAAPSIHVRDEATRRFRAGFRGGPQSGVVSELRRLDVDALLPPGAVDPEDVEDGTGLTVIAGTFRFDGDTATTRRRLRGRPGSLLLYKRDGSNSVAVRLSWQAGALRVRLRAEGVSPVAATYLDREPGEAASALDAEVRIGGSIHYYLGELHGTLAAPTVAAPGGPVRLPSLVLETSGPLAAFSAADDAAPPAIVVDFPTAGPIRARRPMTVRGRYSDDRAVEFATVSVEGGPAVLLDLVPDGGGLRPGTSGTFSLPLQPLGGRNVLEFGIRDRTGKTGTARVEFLCESSGFGVAGGVYHGAFAGPDGTVHAWGAAGRIDAAGTFLVDLDPLPVPGLAGVTGIAAGGSFNLALLEDGTVHAWGSNYAGALGDGTTTDRSTPGRVQDIAGVVSIAAGAWHSLALLGDGTVMSWGWNAYGQVGDGTTVDRHLPVVVQGLPPIRSIGTSQMASFAVDEDGKVWCWGDNSNQVLGFATAAAMSATPVLMNIPDPVVTVAGGGYTAVALTEGGEVYAWGWDTCGNKGGVTGTGLGKMPGITGIVGAAVGMMHTMLLTEDGKVLVCGTNASGQLGSGAVDQEPHAAPQFVPDLEGVRAVAAGYLTCYALLEDGTVLSWGRNANGEVGDGTTTDRLLPFAVPLPE